MNRRGRGRPRGSKNRQYDQVEVEPSRCRKCGSTAKAPYFNVRIAETPHQCDRQGREFNYTAWKRTLCLDCGQHRVDIVKTVHDPRQNG